MGKLRGVLLSPTLRSIIEEILSLPQDVPDEFDNISAADVAVAGTKEMSTTDVPPSSARSTTVCSTPAASLARVKETKRNLISSSLSVNEATSLLEATCDNFDTGDATAAIPLEQFSALKLLISSSTSQDEANKLLVSLEKSIKPTALVYERAPVSSKINDASYAKRMAYLRKLSEERSYLASTSNLQRLNAHNRSDDVNVKSMMYATSVGLNMIVAPISFGVFMYFFAGSLFNHFFPDSTKDGAIDVRQVIAGVISGVILLFIEMILFVIRSHELDASVRKKRNKKGYKSNPFGYTSRAMERTYKGEMD